MVLRPIFCKRALVGISKDDRHHHRRRRRHQSFRPPQAISLPILGRRRCHLSATFFKLVSPYPVRLHLSSLGADVLIVNIWASVRLNHSYLGMNWSFWSVWTPTTVAKGSNRPQAAAWTLSARKAATKTFTKLPCAGKLRKPYYSFVLQLKPLMLFSFSLLSF